MNLDGNITRRQGNQAGPCPRAGSGFSLIELLIVMALIITMFTLYWGGGPKGYQTRQIANCAKNLQTISVALKAYEIDNHDRYPELTNAQTSEPVLSQLVPRATTSTEFFICPGSKDSKLPDAEPFAKRRISYAYYMGHTSADGAEQPLISDRQVNAETTKWAGQPLFSPDGKKPGNNHAKYGGNVLFCDGSVQASDTNAAFNLTNSPGVILLNPKP